MHVNVNIFRQVRTLWVKEVLIATEQRRVMVTLDFVTNIVEGQIFLTNLVR